MYVRVCCLTTLLSNSIAYCYVQVTCMFLVKKVREKMHVFSHTNCNSKLLAQDYSNLKKIYGSKYYNNAYHTIQELACTIHVYLSSSLTCTNCKSQRWQMIKLNLTKTGSDLYIRKILLECHFLNTCTCICSSTRIYFIHKIVKYFIYTYLYFLKTKNSDLMFFIAW